MLQFNADGRVAEIVINRPGAGNAFTGEMARQLGQIMREAAQSADVVIIRGEGADFTIGRDRHDGRHRGCDHPRRTGVTDTRR